MPGGTTLLKRRIRFLPENVDLCSLPSVRNLARKLQSERGLRKLDVAIFNAGMGGWTGINFWWAVKEILTDFPYSVTYPCFKIGEPGLLLPRQCPLGSDCQPQDEPRTGEVFTANVLGHYMLARWLAPLMSRSAVGRCIWVSSLEAYDHMFDRDDFQGIANPNSYESSKRITDALVITSRLPSTEPWTDKLFAGPPELRQKEKEQKEQLQQPQMYVCHPGIIATGIMPLNFIFVQLMFAAFWIARWVGSPWHPIAAYKGACAPVWLALSPQQTLDTLEERDGVGKWGSSCDWAGNERVERTEIEGWGLGGIEGDIERGGRRRGRYRGAKSLTAEDRETFEEFGRGCWREMERVRVEWEALLDRNNL